MNIEINDDNMYLWNLNGKTDPADVKKVSKGAYSFSAINAYSQIRTATKTWGPMGKWGLRDIETQSIGDYALMTATFFYPDGEFDVSNSIDTMIRPRNKEPRHDDEFAKKLMTDTLTKALSFLGFNNDIFNGKWDDARYVQQRTEEVKKEKEAGLKELREECEDMLLIKVKGGDLNQEQGEKFLARIKAIDNIDELIRARTIIKEIVNEPSTKVAKAD